MKGQAMYGRLGYYHYIAMQQATQSDSLRNEIAHQEVTRSPKVHKKATLAVLMCLGVMIFAVAVAVGVAAAVHI